MRSVGRGAAVAAVLGVAIVAALSWPFTVDDAYVVLRHAESLVGGGGWAMNAGTPSDGVTGPLWIVPFVVGEVAGLDGMVIAKLAGAVCVVLAVWLVVRSLAGRAGGATAAPAAVVVLAVQPTLGIWSVGGLETGAATLALAVLGLAAVGRGRRSRVAIGIAAASIVWLRPELVPAAAILAAGSRSRGLALGAVAAGVVTVVAFRLAMFGHVLPLAIEAKPGEVGHGLQYAGLGALIVTGIGGAVLAVAGARRRERFLALAIVAHLLVVAVAGGDWMPGFRLLAPVLPLYAYLAGLGVARLLRTRRRVRLGRAGAVLLLALALAAPVLDLVVQLPAARDAGARRERQGRRLARWIRVHASSVALVDVGYLGWASGARVIDLGGITDAEVARRPGGHLSKEIDPGWLESRAPEAIVLHASVRPEVANGMLRTLAAPPVERRVAAMPFVRGRYRVAHVADYAPGYVYVVLVRR